jgi:hypothetical protein
MLRTDMRNAQRKEFATAKPECVNALTDTPEKLVAEQLVLTIALAMELANT